MPKPPPAPAPRPAPRLYLVTPVIEDAAAFAAELRVVLDAADIAAVLLRLKEADERTLINRVKALMPVVQKTDVALVLDGRADLVARAGADGAHLTGIDKFSAAIASLKPERIAGCGGLHTRHDAMLAAESGADYVMFGEIEAGERPSFDAIIERIAWWAEVFEAPCVGYAATLDEVGPFVAAGADFVAIGHDGIWNHAEGAQAALALAAAWLAAPETTA